MVTDVDLDEGKIDVVDGEEDATLAGAQASVCPLPWWRDRSYSPSCAGRGFASTNENDPATVAAPLFGCAKRSPAKVLAMQGTAVLVAIVPTAPTHHASTAPSAPTWSE